MLTNLFVSRNAHDKLKGERAKLLELLADWKQHTKDAEAERDLARVQCDDAKAERDAAHDECDDLEKECEIAIKKFNDASDIVTRALVLLNKVDTTRTGGKQLQALIDSLLADAKEHGLWGEVQE